MGRRIVALTAGLLLLGLGSARAGGAPGQEVVREVRLPGPAGTLSVAGRPVQTQLAHTDEPVEAVLLRERGAVAGAPVDWVEEPIPGGWLLSVLDVHRGEHRVVQIRRVDGKTEVLRGWAPLGAAPTTGAPLQLPAGWAIASEVEDRIGGRRVWTAALWSPLAPAPGEASLLAALAGAGWHQDGPGSLVREGRTLALEPFPVEGGTLWSVQIREDE